MHGVRRLPIRLSSALSSKFHTLKKYFLSFTARTLFYSIIFFNHPYPSYSKFILYINYHPYFIIFSINNFFSHLISTNIIFLFLILIPRSAARHPEASRTKIFQANQIPVASEVLPNGIQTPLQGRRWPRLLKVASRMGYRTPPRTV
jgi:hypothetical protein